MALEDILETIRSESESTASSVVAAAREEAAELLERAAAMAEEEKRKLSESLDDRARIERSRIVSYARLEMARQRREAREEIYQAAIQEVKRRLGENRSNSEYPNVVGSLLDEALAVLPDARVISVDPGDRGLVEDLLASRGLDLEVRSEEMPLGGVRVVTEGRDVDNTLATRLERADSHLRYLAGELLPALRGSGQ